MVSLPVEYLPGREDGRYSEVGTTNHRVVLLSLRTFWHAECSLAATYNRWLRSDCRRKSAFARRLLRHES